MQRRHFLTGFAALGAWPGLTRAAEASRFSVKVVGRGPDVILIPGLGCSAEVWRDTVAQLRGLNRVHVVQIAGFAGLPPGPNASGEILRPVMEQLAAYIAVETRAPPSVIGHSVGGLMGMMLAISHPEAVGRLMVVDALPFIGVLFSPSMTLGIMMPQAAQMRDQQLGMGPDEFRSYEEQAVRRLVTSPRNQARVAAWNEASDRSVFVRATYEDMVTDLRPDLGAIKAPLTLVYPHLPELGPPEVAQAFYRDAFAGLPSVKLVRIENSRHFIMLDQPQAFADAVRVWLDEPAQTSA